jgi:hypothetical protein
MAERCVLKNELTNEFIGVLGKPVAEFPDALIFESWGKAVAACQNHGPEWVVVDVENA